MFERYTEKARRVIFFARYEASQYGSTEIDTDHLLLGLAREERLLRGWLPNAHPEIVRKRIDSATPHHQPIPTNIDLPLSEASKQALYRAKDEADRLNSKHIGTEHLLLGLIQETESAAGKLLRELGADLATLRKTFEGEVERPQGAMSTGSNLSRRRPRSAAPEVVQIHGISWDGHYIDAKVRSCRAHNWYWHKAIWKPRDVVIESKTGCCSFDLGLVDDSGAFQLVKGGWKKDHCAVCQWELFESHDDHGRGYTNGHDWVCVECYEKFWQRPDFIAGSYSDMT